MPKTKDKHTDLIWSRVDSIITLILENDRYLKTKRMAELVSIVKERFRVEERTAFRYISEAKAEIRRIGKVNSSEALMRAIRDREFLLQKTKGIKNEKGEFTVAPDYKLYLETIKDRDKLLGLYEEKVKSEVSVKNYDMSRFTEHGLERLKRGDSIDDVLRDPKSVKSD